jgi:hypothetical protein
VVSSGPIFFGARRALFDTPEVRRSQLGFLAIVLAGVIRDLTTGPRVDLENRQIVLGRKAVAFDQIDTAQLEVSTGFAAREIWLRFGVQNGPQVLVQLCVGGELAQTPWQRQIVLEIVNQSEIRMPTSSYDPTGSHARWNFPTNLTKAQAIGVVTNPPRPGDPLPTPPTW